ncbi:MAG: hypothetical protein KDD40_06095, partial [Bdellovibrionales bacterium]|nr:hypothetical protein [Bdellovibrionales bacterium]
LFLNGPIDLSRKLFVMSEFQTTDKGGPIWIFNRVLEKDQNSHILYSGKESELASQEQLMIVCDMGVFEKDLTTEVFTNIPGLMYSTEPEIEYNW